MRIRTFLLAVPLLLLACAASRGQTPVLAWDADASAARPAQADVYRGETVALRPAFLERGAPADTNGAAFTLYWQTNGMGAAWWSDPTNAFRWTPARDCGAAAYTLFIRCDTAAGASYRANARLRMLDSPGAEPNALPLPAASLDFARLTVLNPPWPSAADLQAASNALAAAVQPLGPRLDLIEGGTNAWQTAFGWGDHALAGYLLPAALAPYATTQQVAQAAAAIPRDRITTLDGSQWIDATGSVWRVSSGGGGYWTISILGTLYGSATNAYYEVRSAPFDFWAYDQAFFSGDAYFRWYPDGPPGSGHVYLEAQGVEEDHDYNYPTNDLADGVFEFYTRATYTHCVLAWSNDLASVSTQRVDGLAWQSDLPLYATTQQVAAALAPMATTGYVAQASLADADGYTTQIVMRVGSEITTNRWGPRLTLPDGIVTNGTASDVVLGDLKFSGSSISSVTDPNRVHMVFFGGTYFINTILCAAFGGNYDAPSVVASGKDGGAEDLYQGFSHKYGPLVYQVKHDGSLITSNNVTAYGTNTAAVVRSQSSYLMPHLGTNTTISLIFTNGTLQAWEIAQ